ncbi:hypothetical protein [Streptomyces sp. NPDC060022]|uniref:hypothetical protein n=1 Tax=Streptomyces sp. NPDC060022 TaxID=3347039 RepID=UPI003676A272
MSTPPCALSWTCPPAAQRNRGIVVSAHRVRHSLGQAARRTLAAQELREEIAQFSPAVRTPGLSALPR